jgi:hypothetical protein
MTAPEFEIHECEHLPESGIQVISAWDYALRETATWMLVIQRDATAEDLEKNSYLENEGDTLWFTHVEVSHCPYCGEKLTDLSEKTLEDYGKFRHVDLSGWNPKIR